MKQGDAANRLERLLRRDLDEAAREAGPPSADEIDAYVAGRASAAEREVIESWLADDPAFREEVDAVMAMRQAIEGEATGATTPASREASAPARKPSSTTSSPPPSPAVKTRTVPPTAMHATARQMRARPLRTAAVLAIAASLTFFILWVASPGRPPIESQSASGSGSAGSGGASSGTAASGAANSGTAPSPSAPAATLTLRDAGSEVSLLANGELRGLEGLDASNRSAIARALASGQLELTSQIDALAASASVLRAPGEATAAATPALRVVRPLATAVRTARPTFEWTAIPGASSYRVRIANAALDPVTESPTLTTTHWTPEAPLPSGRVLMWQVEAQTTQGTVVAPAPPASEARILVLRAPDAESLTRALNAANGSDLAAAVALARLAAANRNADAITRLRQQLSDRRFPR